MTILRTRSRVADDGTVTIPVGTDEAGTEVDVTVAPVLGKSSTTITQQEWVELIEKSAGSIDDPTFVRPEQLPIDPAPDFD